MVSPKMPPLILKFQNTIYKYNWNLLYCKSTLKGSKLHFYLKCIALEMDMVKSLLWQELLSCNRQNPLWYQQF